MKLFGRESAEERFWRWFLENSSRLFNFESDQEKVFDELRKALRRVHKGLTFEFGPVQDGSREFIVSADGIRDRFPGVLRLVKAAPSMPEWIVVPFRPPKSLEGATITFGEHRLGPDDIWFAAEPDGERIGLTICIKGLTEDNQQALGGAAFILLDSALGEYAVEMQVGYIDLQPLPADPRAAGLRPFGEIREVFDTTTH
jgi:hypothetical protein